jgi:hypothetical protein
MDHSIAVALSWLVFLPPTVSQPTKPNALQSSQASKVADEIRALQKDCAAALEKLRREDAPKSLTSADHFKIFNKEAEIREPYLTRVLALAEKNPRELAAKEALLSMTHGLLGKTGLKAIVFLARNYPEDAHVGSLSPHLLYEPGAEDLLRTMLRVNRDHAAQETAALTLARWLKSNSEEIQLSNPARASSRQHEAEELFERVSKNAADIRCGINQSLADRAKDLLSEMRELGIGRTAPDIDGEDADGKAFKLRDYRAKVVVIDFWASW